MTTERWPPRAPPVPPTRFGPGSVVRVIAGSYAGTVTKVLSPLICKRWIDGPERGRWTWVHQLDIPLTQAERARYGGTAIAGAPPHYLKPYREGDDPSGVSLDEVLDAIKRDKVPQKEDA